MRTYAKFQMHQVTSTDRKVLLEVSAQGEDEVEIMVISVDPAAEDNVYFAVYISDEDALALANAIQDTLT